MSLFDFVEEYNKYLNEISSVIRPELFPIIDELESKKLIELLHQSQKFNSENDARGFVWNLFVEEANKYAHQKITIDIKDIQTLEDVEMFFILLEKEHISYHPETSFRDIISKNLNGNITGPTFTPEESDRLDMLMMKCIDLCDELYINMHCICRI